MSFKEGGQLVLSQEKFFPRESDRKFGGHSISSSVKSWEKSSAKVIKNKDEGKERGIEECRMRETTEGGKVIVFGSWTSFVISTTFVSSGIVCSSGVTLNIFSF